MSEDLTPRYRGECGHCSYVAHSLESMQEHLDVHSQNDEEHGTHLDRISDPVESDSDSEVCIRPDPDSETESDTEWHEWSDNTPHPFEFHQETFQNSQGSDLHLGTCDTDYVHRRLRVESDMTLKPEDTESSCIIKQESDVEEVADELGTSPGFTSQEDTLEVTHDADSDVNKIVESEVGEPEPHLKSQPGLKEKAGNTSVYYCAHCDFESVDLVLVQRHTMDEHTAGRQEDHSPHCDTEIYENQCKTPPECPWWYETDHTYCRPPPCHTIQAVVIERPEGEPPRIIVRQTPVQFNNMISDSGEEDTAESNDNSWVLEKDEEGEGGGDKKEVYDETNGYLCTFNGCGATYGLRADFCSHVIACHTMHGAQLYYCAYCKFVAVEAESVSLHTAKMHQKEKNFFRNLKSGALSLPEELSNSLMKETEEGFHCQVCQYETEFRDVIILHAWRAHRATMVNKLEKSLPGFTQVVEKKGILKVISALLVTSELFYVEKKVLPCQELRPIVAPKGIGKSNTQARMLSLLKRANPYPQTCIKNVKRRKRRIMNDVCVGCAVCNNFAAKRKRCKKSDNECIDNSKPVSTEAGSSSNVISDDPQDKQDGRPYTRRSRRNRELFYNQNKTTRTDPTPISDPTPFSGNDQEQNRRKTLDIDKFMASIQCDEAMAVAEVQFRGGQRTTEGVASTAGLPRLPKPDESTSVELQNGLPTFLMLPIVLKTPKGLGRMPEEQKSPEDELATPKPGELLRSLAAVLKLANGKANVIMQITCTHLCTTHKVIKSQQTRGDKVVIFHQSGDNVTHSEVLVPQQTLHTASVLATINNNEWCLKNASRGQKRMKAKVNVGSEHADGDGDRLVLPKPPSESPLRRLLAARTLNDASLLKKKGTPFREVNTTPAKAVLDDHTANGCHDNGSDHTEISFRGLRDINTGANRKNAASANLKSKQTNQRKKKKVPTATLR